MEENHKRKLIEFFETLFLFDFEEQTLIEDRIKIRRIKRKQLILQETSVCNSYYFVAKGCLRLYNIDDKGCEHNLQFAAEGDWICDIGSFYSGEPSRLNIETIENSIIIQIVKEDLYYLFRKIPKIHRVFKIIIENKYVELQNHLLDNISSTAIERYNRFVQLYPSLINRLANVYIASYIGITPEFLSKIRKELYK